MPAILFVDDEQGVLDGLRRQLRRFRDVWELDFVTSAEQALERLAKRPVAVIITDVRMPGTDGLALLREVRRLYPETTRVVLSGYAPPDDERAVFQVAHRVLPKPCEHDYLVDTLKQALKLRELIGDPAVTALVGGIERLPSVPQVYTQLVGVLDDPDSDAQSVTRVIERDPTLVASVLRVANSVAFAPAEPITRVRDAVTYLGRRLISNMVLGVAALERFTNLGLPAVFMRTFQADAMAGANLASRLADRKDRDDAFAAGMLHDIGQLVLLAGQPDRYAPLFDEARATRRPLTELEVERLGASHDRAGAYLLGLWGLPFAVVTAVASHHAPLDDEPPVDGSAARALRVAVRLLERAEGGEPVNANTLSTWPLTPTERARVDAWLHEALPRRGATATTTLARPMTYRTPRRP